MLISDMALYKKSKFSNLGEMGVNRFRFKAIVIPVILISITLILCVYHGLAANEKVAELMPDQETIFNPTLLWFLLGLALIFLEFIVPGVILVFFGIGAWAAAATSYLGLTASFKYQLIVFAIVSIALLVVLRKWIKGKFYGHVADVQDLSKNIDEFTGQSVVVLQDIIPDKMDGAVEFKGARWRAISEDHIKTGELAVIIGVDGIILSVRKKREG